MTATYMVPSLSSSGWNKSAEELADYILTAYIYSKATQSKLAPEVVYSLPEDLANNTNDKYGIVKSVRSSLENLFKGYFDTVEVTVTLQDPTNVNVQLGSDDRMVLKTEITYVDSEGVSHSAGYDVTTFNSKFEKFIKLKG